MSSANYSTENDPLGIRIMSFTRNTVPIPESLQAKWPGKTLSEGFVPFPKRLMRCAGKLFVGETGIDDLRVILSIVDFTRQNQLRDPSYAYLAFMAGMSAPKFKSRVDAMRERRWLDVSGTDDAIKIEIHGLCQKIEMLTNDANDADDVDETT
jgi:hypothetical protein